MGGEQSMAALQRIVVIGGSSGGIQALRVIASGLRPSLPAAVCVVVHTSPDAPGLLDAILTRAGGLPAVTASAGVRLEAGRVYVAPPDHHLLVEPGVLQVTKGPRENRFRPAIDPLFRSAAQVYGPEAVGVLLTGNLDDGIAGLRALKQLGGIAIVQDPRDAEFPELPQGALQQLKVDHVVGLAEMAPLVSRVVASAVEARARVPAAAEWMSRSGSRASAAHLGGQDEASAQNLVPQGREARRQSNAMREMVSRTSRSDVPMA